MKKIAMITFHASHNNGSMLQALALQTALQQRNLNLFLSIFIVALHSSCREQLLYGGV